MQHNDIHDQDIPHSAITDFTAPFDSLDTITPKPSLEPVCEILASLEGIREDLTGIVRKRKETNHVSSIIFLVDDEKEILDSNIDDILKTYPELGASLESIVLCDERNTETLLSIIDNKINSFVG